MKVNGIIQAIISTLSIGWIVEHVDDIMAIVLLAVQIIVLSVNLILKIKNAVRSKNVENIEVTMEDVAPLLRFNDDLKEYYERRDKENKL